MQYVFIKGEALLLVTSNWLGDNPNLGSETFKKI